MLIKYTVFCQWRLESKDGEPYGPRSLTQHQNAHKAMIAFADLLKFYDVNIRQGDCHLEMIANIDAPKPKDT